MSEIRLPARWKAETLGWTFVVEQTPGGPWVARPKDEQGTWEAGVTLEEALGKLVVTLGQITPTEED